MIDRQESVVYTEKQIKIPSYIVLKKHLLLVISVIACIFTILGWYMGTTNWLWKMWYSWVVVVSSLISTPLAVGASIRLNHILLLIYVLVGSLEVAFKIVFVTYVFRQKHEIANTCTAISEPPLSLCKEWRLDDLNLTNSIVFHTISSLSEVILIVYSVQLTIFAFQRKRKRLQDLRNRNGISGPCEANSMNDLNNQDMFQQSEPNEYGTFQEEFVERFRRKHNMTTTM